MPLLDMRGVYKRYGGVQALKDASLSVTTAEVHGLIGPNGSGKSTMNKVLTGTVRPDRATIHIDGEPVVINKPMDAYTHQISAVYQQLSLVPNLSVAQNLVLGTETTRATFVDNAKNLELAEEALEPFLPGMDRGFKMSLRAEQLSPGSQQLVEIAKAIGRKPRILVLDEATASLRRDQVELVFQRVRELVEEDVAVIFVSHRLEEIMGLCHRATILRNGESVATVNIEETSEQELVRLMVGEKLARTGEELIATKRPPVEGEPLLVTKNLQADDLNGIDIDVRPGEVVGLGGLQGQGQSELLQVLFGDEKRTGGEATLDGVDLGNSGCRANIAKGLALVPGDRGTQGLMMSRPILENLNIVSLKNRLIAKFFISMGAEKKAAGKQIDQLQIKLGQTSDPVTSLSGGNAQKVVIGKWLANNPKVVLLDDPTKGVDVGAKGEIYQIIRDLTAQGVAVILNSSDDEELIELCDRVFVLYEGTVVDHLQGPEITRDNLIATALRVDAQDSGSRASNAGVTGASDTKVNAGREGGDK